MSRPWPDSTRNSALRFMNVNCDIELGYFVRLCADRVVAYDLTGSGRAGERIMLDERTGFVF